MSIPIDYIIDPIDNIIDPQYRSCKGMAVRVDDKATFRSKMFKIGNLVTLRDDDLDREMMIYMMME